MLRGMESRRRFLTRAATGLAVAAGFELTPEGLWERKKLVSIPAATTAIETISYPGACLITIADWEKSLASLERGSLFHVAGIYSVNPQTQERAIHKNPVTGRRYQYLQAFVRTNQPSRPLPREATHFPPIISSGPYKNCEIDRADT
jgi:hypothetical protein